MNRRSLLKFSALLPLARPLASLAQAAPMAHAGESKGIVLYCDLAVDPAREQEMLKHYHEDFKPAAEKFEGYVDLKMVRIRKTLSGAAPTNGVDYRFQLTYKSEELRQKWIASPTHRRVWPLIENTVTNKDYQTLLTDIV